mmetsp:Transcript_23041/g.55494  ORF Transcript_23041/g.55494 Transcript_23041/m.55494 type:complete len:129 (+) Transcript_23041:2061-2447(+)
MEETEGILARLFSSEDCLSKNPSESPGACASSTDKSCVMLLEGVILPGVDRFIPRELIRSATEGDDASRLSSSAGIISESFGEGSQLNLRRFPASSFKGCELLDAFPVDTPEPCRAFDRLDGGPICGD